MKTTVILLHLVLFSWGARAQHDHSKMESKMNEKASLSISIQVKNTHAATSVLENYLALKDALVQDNGQKAANSGKALLEALKKFDLAGQPASKQVELKDILEDAKENAEHISENGDKIDHQREHFELLGTDLKDLIIITGSDRTLYQIFCPMYNNKKGGNWLSESKEIKNPFYGSKMLKCGSVVQEITLK